MTTTAAAPAVSPEKTAVERPAKRRSLAPGKRLPASRLIGPALLLAV